MRLRETLTNGMALMSKIKLQYVQEYIDRHGKVRRYFRRPNCKRIFLPGSPGSDEFMAVYQAALGQSAKPGHRRWAQQARKHRRADCVLLEERTLFHERTLLTKPNECGEIFLIVFAPSMGRR